ncbi:hypothetical protein [Tengunoibacter tsumagoiensis]|uniref:Uncharacterized protein n=1 Tax=Tengunoibacter tsumagoiensis TaxID=2014871 RepID=A0A402AB02_9CHLR|nr:hypothetical protein [Tengunoibacter tsumagoiensis]GCE16135.1 hypothetical protein KTT_59940 [Tengunoibacter tsumagoiensis]
MKRFRKLLASSCFAIVVAFTAVAFLAAPASAHEKRHVGPYTFIVGFLTEPAYAQQSNSLDLTICNGDACTYTVTDGAKVVSNPVNDADKTLKVEVSAGSSAPLALPIVPRWANPGKYNAYFAPSVTGDYTFHIFGTLNNEKIDEKFTSSPTGFGSVGALKVYPAVQDKGNVDIAGLKDQVQSAQQAATTATGIGIAGAVLGVLGLGAAAFALTRKPRQETRMQQPEESLRG